MTWHIPSDETTAEKRNWIKVPGEQLFDTLIAALGKLPIIAEDLGVITPENTTTLRDRYNFPGMKILQFAFEKEPINLPPYPKAGSSIPERTTMTRPKGWYDSITDARTS
ncbi:MAG: 4-alpha-glucanotransferase [Geobacteraceae bacterium]|nr:4-alpha-glucanotransferase [Geobacteraceae bacterium]